MNSKRRIVTKEYHGISVEGTYPIQEILDHINDALENGCTHISFSGDADEDCYVWQIYMSMEIQRPENDDEYNYRMKRQEESEKRELDRQREQYERLKAKFESNE